MEKLLEILEDIKPGVDFKNQQHLATGGILRSFDILSLVSEIQEAFRGASGMEISERSGTDVSRRSRTGFPLAVTMAG